MDEGEGRCLDGLAGAAFARPESKSPSRSASRQATMGAMFSRRLTLWLSLALVTACGKDGGQERGAPELTVPPAEIGTFEQVDGPLPADAVHGQVIYVPIYSSIYSHTSKRMIDLTATLSIHNTDASKPVFVRSARYFDTSGKLLEERAPTPIRLAPMQTVSFVVDLADKRGGAGANFVVEWVGEQGVRSPVVEAVMVNVSLSNAMAFTSDGRVVETIKP
jgi:hypothetical protein